MRRMRTWALAAGVLLAACSGDPAPRPSPSRSPSASPSVAAPPSPTGIVLVETAETSFRSPTGNIACDLSDAYAVCAVKERTWSPPPGSDGCRGTYAAIEHFDGNVLFTCADATIFTARRVLPYGTTLRIGELSCASERSGMTCVVGRARHGFTLSRERYRVF